MASTVQVPCTFTIKSPFLQQHYSCCIFQQEIPENSEINLIGDHQSDKSNADVTGLYISQCKVTKIPKGLSKVFPNIKVLSIRTSDLKSLSKSDLAEYKNLEFFFCEGNFELTFVPGDLFDGFKNLKVVSFFNDWLILVEPNILDGLEKLIFADFQGVSTTKYQFLYSSLETYAGNVTLDELKVKLREEYEKTKHLRSQLVQNS